MRPDARPLALIAAVFLAGLLLPSIAPAQTGASSTPPAVESQLQREPAGEPDESLRQLQIYFLQESERLRRTARVEYGLGVLFSVASATLAVIGAGGENDDDGMLLAAGVAGLASVVSTTIGLFTDTNAHQALEKAVQLEVTGRLDLPVREERAPRQSERDFETPRRFQKNDG